MNFYISMKNLFPYFLSTPKIKLNIRLAELSISYSLIIIMLVLTKFLRHLGCSSVYDRSIQRVKEERNTIDVFSLHYSTTNWELISLQYETTSKTWKDNFKRLK